jgi:DNA-binding transcriptional MerR regulator
LTLRGLAIEIRTQGLTLADLSSLLRLYNFFREPSARQGQIEAFIERVHSGGMSQDKIVEYVNQLYDISREQSIALEHVPDYVKEKLEEKQKIDQDIKEANDVLQTKNANIEAIHEHRKCKSVESSLNFSSLRYQTLAVLALH